MLKFLGILFAIILLWPPPPEATRPISYGYLTFDNVKWNSTSAGMIPADSLPWKGLTHVTLFAADGTTPIKSSYFNQLLPMTSKAHQNGVQAGLCYGGSGDAALLAKIADPTQWSAFAHYNADLARTKSLDFFELDIEGSTTLANVQGFVKRLNDTLKTIQSTLTGRPVYVVLTVTPKRSKDWVSLEPNVGQLNLMSYDNIGDWWGRIIHDNSVKSRKGWNGALPYTDYLAGMGVNSEAPSMQKSAIEANTAGWPKSKIVVGFDVNPTWWANGPTRIRQLNVPGMTDASSDLDFWKEWPTISAFPAGSIKFDDTSYAYSAYVNGKLWTLMALPGGYDKPMAGTRMLVDSLKIGGAMFWNLGEEVWNTTSPPPGGRGWFYAQINKHWSAGTIIPPPPLDTDGDGIPDASDQCPTIPGTKEYYGCPAPPLPPHQECNYDSARNWGFILGYASARQDSSAIYQKGYHDGRVSYSAEVPDSVATILRVAIPTGKPKP